MPQKSGETTTLVKERQIRTEDYAAVLGQLDWTVGARRVIVFRGENRPPITRLEVDVEDSSKLAATADALATTLQERGITLGADYEPWIPSNEIWLTLPHADGTPALISLPAGRALPETVARQVNPAVSLS